MKYLGINLIKYVQDSYEENSDEQNQRRTKEMENYFTFMDWKTQPSKDVNSPQINLQIQSKHSSQNPRRMFTWL